MPKRTQKQIELDCKRIQEAAQKAISMKEIEKLTGLSQSEIKTSLSKHPRISTRVRNQLEKNKVKSEVAPQRQEDNSKSSKKAEEHPASKVSRQTDYEYGFVIDTSMVEVDSIYEFLSQICATTAKIILTSIVRQELNTMQFVKKDYKAQRARSIMAMAAERPEKFHNVLIDETLPTHDDCIVKYCAENKNRVTLLTADKNMALDAREQSIKVEFFRKYYRQSQTIKKVERELQKSDIRTLNPARKVGDKLLILEMQGIKRDIRVLSDGQEFVDGVVQLKVGDDVLIASKKADSITFAHYQMINLYEEYNCKSIYNARIYRYSQIDELPKACYKAFARDFWNKFWGSW